MKLSISFSKVKHIFREFDSTYLFEELNRRLKSSTENGNLLGENFVNKILPHLDVINCIEIN